ncbi:N-acetylmuramoyl-L-alanine amidase [Rivularia sp. UHCC 0363]|uniref:N-acetylmuramoyl-L-alanine amidase n=1 Tax=Rivularia sp. UHCC 0363 TaxID=3110244 RepID=UPI002B2175A3|nr:N-acetylmuramoyl-L-alanine amidase [Rivularia sp. UHCC 0363]MEA5598223.1 N-acetylmuramoyl-L-alanine amidase [Rivularia sp. UHCC 0363]
MKIHWLVSGTTFLSVLMLSSPARGANLSSWRFNADQNQLEFQTDGAVQPQAQLIFNPTRLVIDLPGTTFGRPQLTKPIGGAIRSIRVGQFDPQTARLVVEMNPGYTLDPDQVKFVGISPTNWTVQLPSAKTEANAVAPRSLFNVIKPTTNTAPSNRIAASTTNAATQIESLRVTQDGFYIRTSGAKPKINNPTRDRNEINIDIPNAALSPEVQRDIAVNKFAVNRVQFSEIDGKSPGVRMTLQVEKKSPDWRAATSGNNALIVLPNRTTLSRISSSSSSSNSSNSTEVSQSNFPVPPIPTANNVATIESVELAPTSTQLLIRGDRNLSAVGGWDRQSGLYRITVNNAKLAPKVKGPNFTASSPVLRVRLQQLDNNKVAIFVQPASGVQIGELNQLSTQLLSLELQRTRRVIPPITSGGLPPISQPIPRPGGQIMTLPPNTSPNIPRSRVPSGRVVVIIDPGHGGQDPGAIGIGGLQEKDIILPIGQKVAQILEQNGVQAILTRSTDYFVSLQGRVDMAERANANVFVSIHANSVGLSRPDVSGLEVYYYNSGLNLAQTVRSSILNTVSVKDRGVRQARFYVLRKSSMPAILVETGYVTGREDAAKLSSPQYRDQMAQGIANGILNYIRGR